MKLSVIGCGYLGATHAACMAELGHQVIGVDTDPDKVRALNAGQAPFFEPGLDDLLTRHIKSGRLEFTTSYELAAAFADVHFIAVGTPQLPDVRTYDLTPLFDTVRRLGPYLVGSALVIGKSTVPVGTAARVLTQLQERAPDDTEVRLAWNPEFLRESRAVEDTLRPDRMVLGLLDGDRASEAQVRELYRPILEAGTSLIVTDLATAELAKSAANAFLATKISFINAMAEICEAAGADVHGLADCLGRDPRVGSAGMHPGLGFGGGCLPKDLRGFAARAQELGAGQAVAFLHEIDAINLRRRARVVDLAREQCEGTLEGRNVAVWGASFKPGTDDIRDSPALAVADRLARLGARVTVHDPRALDNARKAFPHLGYAVGPVEALTGAELLLHLTEWEEYARIDPRTLTALTAQTRIIDARGTLIPSQWRAAGWTYTALGTAA